MYCAHCGNKNSEDAKFCSACGKETSMSPAYQELAKDFAFAQYAGFWKRAAAYILDILITGAIGGAIGFSGALVFWDNVDLNNMNMSAEAIFNSAGILIAWLYFALMESSHYQATVGKMVMGIKVTDLNGHRISFLRATGRHFGQAVSGLIMGIGYLMAAFTSKKQALHDIMASCLVVNK